MDRAFNFYRMFRVDATNVQCAVIPRLSAASRFLPSACICLLATWFTLPAYAQIDATCKEAAELWIPSADSRLRNVAKWNRSVTFEVFPRDRKSPVVASVTRELDLIARHSGLVIGPASDSSLDLAIVLAPDIAAIAPKVREYVEGYFTEAAPTSRTKIDPDEWARIARNTMPKCSGLNLIINGNIERAFILIQEDQTSDCFTVGFGEIFGLINIRSLYLKKSEYFSPAHIALAFRSLYSEAVKAGMSSRDTKEKIREVCR